MFSKQERLSSIVLGWTGLTTTIFILSFQKIFNNMNFPFVDIQLMFFCCFKITYMTSKYETIMMFFDMTS